MSVMSSPTTCGILVLNSSVHLMRGFSEVDRRRCSTVCADFLRSADERFGAQTYPNILNMIDSNGSYTHMHV